MRPDVIVTNGAHSLQSGNAHAVKFAGRAARAAWRHQFRSSGSTGSG